MKKTDKNTDKNELLKAVKREKTRNYVILYTTVLLIWICLTIFSFVNNFFSGKEFVINLVNNLIGIIPPILIIISFIIFSKKYKIHGEFKAEVLNSINKDNSSET